MKRLFFAFALLACIAAANAHAAEEIGLNWATVEPGVYRIDQGHATIMFSLNHLGYAPYYGRFNKFDGILQVDSKTAKQSSVHVTIDPSSIDTNHAVLEEKLRGENYFNVEKFPAITFASTAIMQTGATTGRMTGDLTLLGKTLPVTLDVAWTGGGMNSFSGKYTLGFTASGAIKRSEFGMTEGVPYVGDEVTLTIAAEFNHAGETKSN